MAWHRIYHGLGQIAVRVEQGQPAPRAEIGEDERQDQSRFAGAGLADEIEMAAAIILVEHDG